MQGELQSCLHKDSAKDVGTLFSTPIKKITWVIQCRIFDIREMAVHMF